MRLLVIEDYAPLRMALVTGLTEAGWTVEATGDGIEAGLMLAEQDFEAVVLDIMLPGRNGLELVRACRAAGSLVPIILLTACDEVADRVEGLNSGANDYLIKPFAFPELLARLRVITRRTHQATNEVWVGDLRLDRTLREAWRAGQRIALSQREYAILELLAMRGGALVTRTEIWEQTYDAVSTATSNVVDVYIGYLRKKIEREDLPRLLHTRRGQGYVLGLEA